MSRAFANGTEAQAWQRVWCDHCAHDHAAHENRFEDGCELLLAHLVDPSGIPEGWLLPPDGYGFHLPPHMLCARFEPCDPCGGDPLTETRVQIVKQVRSAWTATTPEEAA